MADLSKFDINSAANPNNNIFGLPFSEEEARVVILPIPWEVTVSYGAGTARSAEHIFKASLQIDLFDAEMPDAWKQGYYMRPINPKILLKSDFLRKEAELYIDFISKEQVVEENTFMCKSLKDINEGSAYLNQWVYEQTAELLRKDKLVGILGGDHSTPLGYWKAIGEKYGDFGILQIDAHCDLRDAYQGFKYSHASVAYNGIKEIPQLSRIVQVGIRDFSQSEWEFICNSNYRVVAFKDRDIKTRLYEGETWKSICDDIVKALPEKVYISFDIDGLDPKLCPNTGTPVHGGFDNQQINYLIRQIIRSGRQVVGFDLVEVGISELSWDSNVAARELWHLCNFMVVSNPVS
ncbi:MAG: agmatinase family protein [Chitinophagaceae bacterium]|nr:agmatinase family protein [Chitinophagaceae bacterium]